MTTPELASALLKSVHEIFTADQEKFYQYIDKIWIIFDEMGRFIVTEFFLTQLCSLSSGSRMIYHVIEILKEIYVKNQTIFNIFTNQKSLEKLLVFCTMLLKSSRNAEGITTLPNPQKHLLDEKNVFDFIEQLNSQIKCQSSCNIYHDYLVQFLKYDLSDPHSEAHCRRALEILEVFYKEKSSNTKVTVKELVLKLIKETSYLCCLRNKNEYVTVLIRNNKLPMQLWHFTVSQLIKILKEVLCQKSISNKKLDSFSDKKYEENHGEEEMKTTTNNEIWEATINCFENIFKQSEGGYKNITRTLIEDLLASCQEMEVQVVNFIVCDLLPHSLKIPKEKQIKLLSLLDLGCNFDYCTLSYGSQSTSSISRVCIQNLFDLCRYKSEEILGGEVDDDKEEYIRIKVKIAKMSTPILLKRCKEILKTFYDDELKQGSMPLVRSRIDDMKYVLENLKNLEVYSNYHLVDESSNKKSPDEVSIFDTIMRSRKSHLFNLMPFFSEFILCKDQDIKILVKDIFKQINVQIESGH